VVRTVSVREKRQIATTLDVSKDEHAQRARGLTTVDRRAGKDDQRLAMNQGQM